MLYVILQYGLEPVLIQRILVGFEAILENELLPLKMLPKAKYFWGVIISHIP